MQTNDDYEAWLLRRAAELTRLRQSSQALDDSCGHLLRRVRFLEHEVASMRESLSWKLTGPVRSVHGRLLGLCPAERDADFPMPPSVELPTPCFDVPAFRRHPSRIGVDVSSLCSSDAGGGVQRVVRQIATNLIVDGFPDQFVLVDMRGGWPIDATYRFVEHPAAVARADLPVLYFQRLLLLDASWNHWSAISPVIQSARAVGIEVISCVYDLIPIDFPETCHEATREAYWKWISGAMESSDNFVCISRTVAERLSRHLGDSGMRERKKIGWWPLGCDFRSRLAAVEPPDLRRPYVLMVGTLEPRKRHALALDAFEEGWQTGVVDHSLVFVGRAGWSVEDLISRLRRHPEFGRRLFWFDNLEDGGLEALYAGASALLQPSCAEGFGLPIVEGGRFNKPVVLSDIPVFRELVRDDGYFFEPENAGSLLLALQSALAPGALPTSVLQSSWAESTDALRNLVQCGNYQLAYP